MFPMPTATMRWIPVQTRDHVDRYDTRAAKRETITKNP